MEQKFNCYMCGKPLEGDHISDEHIILNGIGGRLRSKDLLCKECNSLLGEESDSVLSESLSFFTDMLQVKKDRDNHHTQVMKDEDGHEVVVGDGGESLKLRRPYFSKEVDGERKIYHITARNIKELEQYLDGQIKQGEMTEGQKNEIMSRAKVSTHRPRLSTQTVIPHEAFPSIVKSAVNYYVLCFHRYDDVKQLIPYIIGKKDCRDIMNLVLFEDLPYTEAPDAITHMIHIEGKAETGVLYALMEYYGLYTYVVFLKEDYDGPGINATYTYDVINGREVNRNFSLPVTRKWIDEYEAKRSSDSSVFFAAIKNRADKILQKWEDLDRRRFLNDIATKAFSHCPENGLITEEMCNGIVSEITNGLVDYLGIK